MYDVLDCNVDTQWVQLYAIMYDDRNVKVCMMFAMCVKNVCIMGACGRFAKGSSFHENV